MEVFVTITALIIFVFFYFIMAQYFAHRKFNYLQETSIAILVGALVGLVLFLKTDFFNSSASTDSSDTSQQFIGNIIFLILLPPIMFEDGYNFPKRKFFQNILYINLFGFIGTILNFVCIWGVLYLFNYYSLITSISDLNEAIPLSNWQILLTAAALSSIEPLVTEKVVDKQRYPKLFSIIFGESLFKDTMSITMFDSIKDMVFQNSQSFDIAGSDVGYLIGKFIEVVVCSILIGFILGFLTTMVFKNFRFLLQQKGISEVALTLLSGYLSYVISEWLTFSGVISMLFCGTVLSHYNIYNLTHQGKEATKITIEVLKITASGLIFFFIGFEIFNVPSFQSTVDGGNKSTFSLSLLGITFLALFVGRAINIYVVSGIGYLITKKEKWRLNSYEYLIIFMSGLVHGAVPFALSVTIPFLVASKTQPALNSSSTVQFNIVCIILITSLIFNAFIPKVEKIMLYKIRDFRKEDPYHPSVKDSFVEPHPHAKQAVQQNLNAPFLTKFKSTTQKYWRKFEEGLLKPHLIFDYYQRRSEIKMEKIKRRREEHERYLARYGDFLNENILSPDDEEGNIFVDVQLSNSSSSDEEEAEEGVVRIRLSKDVDSVQKSHNDSRRGTEQLGPSLLESGKKGRRGTEQQITRLPGSKEKEQRAKSQMQGSKAKQSRGQIEIDIQQTG